MIHYICISVWEEIGDVLQCEGGDGGCTPHTLMCSYTLTHCLCILNSLCVGIILVGYVLLYCDN